MEEGTKSMQIHTPQLDLPELMHRIQSLLPPEKAVRTCVLSKSWLHAFSTRPTLRFTKFAYGVNKIQEKRYMESIDRTLLRYLNDNLPMERIDLHIDTKHPRVLHPAVKWIQLLASKSCLRELSLTICSETREYPFTIPDEIFSCENLNTLSLTVKADTIKVKNLLYLQELKIKLGGEDSSLEIYDVPSIRLFFYHPIWLLEPFKRDALRSVRELSLGGVIMDKAFSNMIKSEFPFLEVLKLKMTDCKLKTLDITCVSLKRLSLSLRKKCKSTYECMSQNYFISATMAVKCPVSCFQTQFLRILSSA
ncbi:F-box protein-like protein [Tanacetum coccineum]